MEIGDKIYLGIIRLVRASLVVAMVLAVWATEWTTLFVSGLALILSFMFVYLGKKYDVQVPIELEISVVLFMFATIFLGEAHGFYAMFWWWDSLLHGFSAVSLGLIGFITMYTLYRGKKVRASDGMILLFAFSFSVMVGALWEIFEFLMDQTFGFNLQKDGLVDTMWDLIVDVIGALIAFIIGFIYLKKGDVILFGSAIRRFKRDNPRFFKSERKGKRLRGKIKLKIKHRLKQRKLKRMLKKSKQ